MSRMMTFSLVSLFGAGLLNAQQPVRRPAGTPQSAVVRMSAESHSNFLAKTGGLIKTPASGPCIAIINCQRRLSKESLNEAVAMMNRNTRLTYALAEKSGTDGVALATEALASPAIGVAIVLVDAKGQPPLVVAPEARWAVVNVAALESKGAAPDVCQSRIKKELWRALGYVMGAANSKFPSCVLKPVFKPEELDAIKSETLCPEPFEQMLQQAKVLGMKTVMQSTYRKACEEGWAPAPTNDLQKAVWDEVKAGKK